MSMSGTKGVVCAYPPWHMTYTWFYGWLPKTVCLSLVLVLLLVALSISLRWAWRLGQKGKRLLPFSILLALLAVPLSFSVYCGNYGVLVLMLLLALFWVLEKNRPLLAGVCWALMMIKPQIAVLFFWPLLFQRQYRAILIAIVICFVATLWPAYIYQESPITLILQIPDMAIPKPKDTLALPGLAYRVLGEYGPMIWMAVCFMVCGVFSFYFRRAQSWVLRFAPALLIFPLWTYSQPHDLSVLLPLYALLAVTVVSEAMPEHPRIIQGIQGGVITLVAITFVKWVWSIGVILHAFDPSGLGWIYRMLDPLLMMVAMLCATGCLFLQTNFREDVSACEARGIDGNRFVG